QTKSGHSIVEHLNNGGLYIYPDRGAGGVNTFTIRSHINKGSYREDFTITDEGRMYVPSMYSNTSSNSANARVSYESGNGRGTTQIYRVTSALKYKQDVQDIDFDYNKLLNVSPKKWKDKGSVLRQKGNSSNVRWSYGLIADEVEDVGLHQYVEYDDGEIEGLFYDRLWTLLIPITRDIKLENESLQETVSLLKHEKELQEAQIKAL